jgi:YVTN family beta-propeller protein
MTARYGQIRRRGWIVGVLTLLLVAGAAGGMLAHSTSPSPVLRTVTVAPQPSAVVVDAATHRVFVAATGSNTIAILDATTGTLLRSVSVGLGLGPRSLAIDERRAHLFVSNPGDNTVSILDARSGRVLRTIGGQDNPWQVGSLVVLGDLLAVDDRVGRVYVEDITDDGISVLNSRTGARLGTLSSARLGIVTPRQFTADPQPYHVVVDGGTGRVFVQRYNRVSVLDARTDRVVRTYVGTPNTVGVLMTVDTRLRRVFAIGFRWLSEFDAGSGRPLRTIAFGGLAYNWVIDNRDNRLFICTGNGVMMLDVRRNTLRSIASIRCGGGMAIDERLRHLYVVPFAPSTDTGIAASPSSVHVLDTRSGALLATIPVGWYAGPIAVDEHSERVFVLNSGGLVAEPDAWAWLPAGLRSWVPFLPHQGVHTRTVAGSVSVLDAAR